MTTAPANRVMARIGVDGIVDTTTAMTNEVINYRGISSVNGTQDFYVATKTGPRYFPSFGVQQQDITPCCGTLNTQSTG